MTNWSSSVCNTNGIFTHYLRTGGNKPPFILLHGLAGDGACWTPVANALEEDFDLIMPDARGHGKSSVPDDGYHYEDLATDLEDFIRILGLSSPILLGHSMGGMTAALVASRKVQALDCLILAEPTFLSPEVQIEVYHGETIKNHHQFINQSFEQALTLAKLRQPHRRLEVLELINRARHQTSITPFQILKPPNPDYKQLVAQIDISSLLIRADQGIISKGLAQELSNLNARLQITSISDASHGLHYDQPEQFIRVVRSFLS